jgi:hypothetical protein
MANKSRFTNLRVATIHLGDYEATVDEEAPTLEELYPEVADIIRWYLGPAKLNALLRDDRLQQ